jgi:hypothetical protein
MSFFTPFAFIQQPTPGFPPTPPPAPAPPATGSIKGWWKADYGVTTSASLVIGWEDASGNGNDAYYNSGSYPAGKAPYYISSWQNGQPAMSGSNADQTRGLSLPNGIYSGNEPHTFVWIGDYSSDNIIGGVIQLGATALNQARFILDDYNNPDGIYWGFYNNDQAYTWPAGAPVNVPTYFVHTYNSSSRVGNGYLNETGSLINPFTFAPTPNTNISGSSNFLMMYIDGGFVAYNNSIHAEIILYDKVLNGTELADLDQYISDKYGI